MVIATHFYTCGGNEQSTHKYCSELLGKETIDTDSYSRSYGQHGNYSTNYQITGRELLTPDEVRMLDNKYALLFIRGERPVMDFKYNMLKHSNIQLTSNGKAKPYEHGITENAIASVSFNYSDIENVRKSKQIQQMNSDYELLSEEEIEKYVKELIENEERKYQN